MVPTGSSDSPIFASIDMGTNTFKLLIIRPDPSSGRFLTVDRHKEQVLLGLESSSAASLLRTITVLSGFQKILHSRNIPPSHTRLVATSAIRESLNKTHFIDSIYHQLGLQVDVLSGEDEARLIYLGVLQFLPIFDNTVLTVDIGGGSTEFVVGYRGEILYSISLNLGHVTLTKGFAGIESMREHIRGVISASDLIGKVKEYDIERVIGSSGTIRHIEKAILSGYGMNLEGKIGVIDEFRRKWCFSKDEVSGFVERLMREESEVGGKLRREKIFKRRSGYIVAGAILLEEIFNCLGIEEMEVSEYALGEGVVVERVKDVYEGHHLISNARWQSVVRLATRFDNKKRMEFAAASVGIAKEIFEGLNKWYASCDDCKLVLPLIDKDLEYLEAACLLHNIGRYTGKKAYHKKSYNIIMSGDHLHGYANEEVKATLQNGDTSNTYIAIFPPLPLWVVVAYQTSSWMCSGVLWLTYTPQFIALLVRHHRKKFPKSNALSAEGFSEEVKRKFNILCTVIRLSTIVQQYQPGIITFVESCDSQEGFKLVVSQRRNQPDSVSIRPSSAEEMNSELEKELEHFRQVHQRNLSIVFPTEN